MNISCLRDKVYSQTETTDRQSLLMMDATYVPTMEFVNGSYKDYKMTLFRAKLATASFCRLLPNGTNSSRCYRKCADLFWVVVKDEIDAYFNGKESSLNSIESGPVQYMILDIYTNFIRPMYISAYTSPKPRIYPRVNLERIEKVRTAKSNKKVCINLNANQYKLLF